MWLFDKIKSGYNRVVNKILDIAIRRDSTQLAHFAVMLGADQFLSYRDEQDFIAYPLLKLCKSRRMLEFLVFDDNSNKYNNKEVMLYAVRNDLFVVVELFIECGMLPDDIVPVIHENYAENFFLMNECKSQEMLDFLINKTLDRNIKNRTVSLAKCIQRLSMNNFSEKDYITQISLANQLLDKGIDINVKNTQSKDTLLHLAAKYTRPLTRAVLALLGRIVALQPELLNYNNADNVTPLDLMKMGSHANTWQSHLECEGYISRKSIPVAQPKPREQPKPPITDKYASMKGMPKREHVLTNHNESRIFFPTNSNKI
jgi:hypothetical protein